MDDVQKSSIRLSHWIDHNIEHVSGYVEVAQILDEQGFPAAAELVREGIRLVEQANRQFESALALLPAKGKRSTPAVPIDLPSHGHYHHRHGSKGHDHEHGE
jgi:hypothetical protein